MSIPRPRRRKSIKVRDAIDFDCPFCKGKASASAERGMVLHTLPVCTTYTRLGPTEYLQAVNAKMATN